MNISFMRINKLQNIRLISKENLRIEVLKLSKLLNNPPFALEKQQESTISTPSLKQQVQSLKFTNNYSYNNGVIYKLCK